MRMSPAISMNQEDKVLAAQPSFGRPCLILYGYLKKTAFGRLFIILTPFGWLSKDLKGTI